jgi:ClpP class serine protease
MTDDPDQSMAHATNTLAQLRKADREDTDDAIHRQHAEILDELADQILEARMELNDPYVVVLADVERALRAGAGAARNGSIDDEGDLRDAMRAATGSVPGEEP